MSDELRDWIERVGHELDTDNVIEELLRSAMQSHRLGMLVLPGKMLEESRLLNKAISHSPKAGFLLPSPESVDSNDEEYQHDKDWLVNELGRRNLPGKTEDLIFANLGVGHGTGAGLLDLSVSLAGLCASAIIAVANWPKAVENIKAWSEAIKGILQRNRRCKPNVEALKIVCVGDLMLSDRAITRIEPGLISAGFGTRETGMTNEEVRVGPVYIVIPVPVVQKTYLYIIGWNGEIANRSQMEYVGPPQEAFDSWRLE